MHPPFLLFLKDSREIDMFDELRRLEASIEAIDVVNGEYEAFDADGRRLHLVVDGEGFPRALPGEMEEEKARKLILTYYADVPALKPTLTVNDMVAQLSTLCNYERSKGNGKSSGR